MTGKSAPEKLPTGTTGGTPQVLLAHHLKQLKLPTVLREYDKVARQCATEVVLEGAYGTFSLVAPVHVRWSKIDLDVGALEVMAKIGGDFIV